MRTHENNTTEEQSEEFVRVLLHAGLEARVKDLEGLKQHADVKRMGLGLRLNYEELEFLVYELDVRTVAVPRWRLVHWRLVLLPLARDHFPLVRSFAVCITARCGFLCFALRLEGLLEIGLTVVEAEQALGHEQTLICQIRMIIGRNLEYRVEVAGCPKVL